MAATADGGARVEAVGGTGGGGGGVSVSLRRRLLLSLETTILLPTFRASFSLGRAPSYFQLIIIMVFIYYRLSNSLPHLCIDLHIYIVHIYIYKYTYVYIYNK